MDIGRNEPCPCGSGKKYKRCCGAPKSDPLELAAGRVRDAQGSAESKVARFVRDEFGADGFKAAWDEFDLTEGRLDRERDDEVNLFFPWVFYDWEPWDQDRHDRRPSEVRVTPAGMCAAGRGPALTPAESDFLMAVVATPTSFHDVIATEPGRTTTLRDVFLDTEFTVFEKLGSTGIRPGDILYGRVVEFDGVALVVGAGQLIIPPRHKGVVLDAKLALKRRPGKLTTEKLCREEPLLRSVYLELREQIVHPKPPVMTNTDGDLIEFHTLTYRIDDAEVAFTALAPLDVGVDREVLLVDAKRDRDGNLRHVTLSWTRVGNAQHGGLPSTTLADFTIDGTSLTVTVNSAKRAKAAQAEIQKRLGRGATSVRDEVRTLDEALAEHRGKPETAEDRAARRRNEELQAAPEVQAMIAKMNADHYATWPDIPLPALKGKTPRAAMGTADGRERVEALIANAERMQDSGRSKMPAYDFNQLRTELGLPRKQPPGPRSIVPPPVKAP